MPGFNFPDRGGIKDPAHTPGPGGSRLAHVEGIARRPCEQQANEEDDCKCSQVFERRVLGEIHDRSSIGAGLPGREPRAGLPSLSCYGSEIPWIGYRLSGCDRPLPASSPPSPFLEPRYAMVVDLRARSYLATTRRCRWRLAVVVGVAPGGVIAVLGAVGYTSTVDRTRRFRNCGGTGGRIRLAAVAVGAWTWTGLPLLQRTSRRSANGEGLLRETAPRLPALL